jgi:putative membrane protein
VFDPIARRAAMAAGMLILVAGCKSQRASDNATMGSDTSSGAMTTGAADTSSMATSAQSGQSAGLSDANIVALLDAANKADSASGAYVITRASNPEVKAFAKLMMGEHHALRAQGQQLAKRLGVTPQMPAENPLQPAVEAEMTALKGAAKGAAFDRTYIEQEIGIHKAVLDLAGKAHDAAQNEELKKLIEQAGPVIQKHLDHAEQIQKKLGKPTA